MYRTFYADGFGFSVSVWLGQNASRAEQQAIWAVVRSLRFPPLREGTIWQDRYYVLGPVSRYVTGSVTAFPSASLPSNGSSFSKPEGFYLIHAPRAFYVITQLFQSPASPSRQVHGGF
jgi:hypothetical protein